MSRLGELMSLQYWIFQSRIMVFLYIFLGVLLFSSAVFYSFITFQFTNPISYFVYLSLYVCVLSVLGLLSSFGFQFPGLSGKMPWELKQIASGRHAVSSDRSYCMVMKNVSWKRPLDSLITMISENKPIEEEGPKGTKQEKEDLTVSSGKQQM